MAVWVVIWFALQEPDLFLCWSEWLDDNAPVFPALPFVEGEDVVDRSGAEDYRDIVEPTGR